MEEDKKALVKIKKLAEKLKSTLKNSDMAKQGSKNIINELKNQFSCQMNKPYFISNKMYFKLNEFQIKLLKIYDINNTKLTFYNDNLVDTKVIFSFPNSNDYFSTWIYLNKMSASLEDLKNDRNFRFEFYDEMKDTIYLSIDNFIKYFYEDAKEFFEINKNTINKCYTKSKAIQTLDSDKEIEIFYV